MTDQSAPIPEQAPVGAPAAARVKLLVSLANADGAYLPEVEFELTEQQSEQLLASLRAERDDQGEDDEPASALAAPAPADKSAAMVATPAPAG